MANAVYKKLLVLAKPMLVAHLLASYFAKPVRCARVLRKILALKHATFHTRTVGGNVTTK